LCSRVSEDSVKRWLSELITQVTEVHSMAWRYGMIRFLTLDRLDERHWRFILLVTGRQIGIGIVVGNRVPIFRSTKRGVARPERFLN